MAERYQFDLLVVGSGISGICAALKASERGLKTAILTKAADLLYSNTFYAQGGIVGFNPDDSAESLYEDIMNAGDELNNIEAVRQLAGEGPMLVKDFLLDDLGVEFDKGENGLPDLTREAAHSARRIYHAGDRTGKSIQEKLIERLEASREISILTCYMGIDVITNSHHSLDNQERYKKTRVAGLYALNLKDNEVDTFLAPNVILATGGMGQIYRHTSNPTLATGDGIAMGYRTGAEIINAEYVQFHPTTLSHRDSDNFLISESLRGEGAILINRKGERFMEKYNPVLKELAPRDEVARAIYRELEQSGDKFVKLDATGIRNIDLKERFPQIFEACLKVGFDIRKDPIPVVPAAHYFCGGVKADLYGRTSIQGLYAVGETACTGIHGANRLASISLLEGLYTGIKAGETIEKIDKEKKLYHSIPDWDYPSREEDIDPILMKSDFAFIQSTMWNYVGIIRTDKRLSRALADLEYMSHRIIRFYKEARITRLLVELRNAVQVSTLITRSALKNRRSCGCHYIRK